MTYRERTNTSVPRRAAHRGIVMAIVIVLIVLSLALFGIWAQTVVREHGRLTNQQWRLQASRLAEAGLQRAIARRAADPRYTQETWPVPAEQLRSTQAAEVRVQVTIDDLGGTVGYEATAEFPAGAARRAQVTKRIDLPNPTPEDQS